MAKTFQVLGTVRIDIDCIIQAENEDDAIRYFEEYAVFEELNSSAGAEDIEVDDVIELKDLDEEPDYITIDGDDSDDEDED